jgi:hypothetical protein
LPFRGIAAANTLLATNHTETLGHKKHQVKGRTCHFFQLLPWRNNAMLETFPTMGASP